MESQGRRNLGLAEQFLQGAWLPFFASPDALTQVVSSLIHCIWGSLCSNSRGFITGATALLHSSTFSSDVNKVTVPSFQMKKHRLGGLNDFFQGQKHGATFKTAGLFHANAHPLHCSVHYRSFCKSSHSDSDFSALLSLTYPEQIYYHLKMKGYQLYLVCSSVQFSHSVLSNSLRPHESQHASPPCPSPTPGVHSDPRPLSPWCHPGISSSVVPFSSCPQALPASESFPISQLFAWGGQSTGVSASASVLPKKSQGWSPSEWTGWISSSQESSPTPQLKSINSSALSLLHSPTLTSYMTTRKTIGLTRQTFVGKVMPLLLNMLSRLVITFLPRSKRLLISWLQSPSAVIWEPPKNKVWHCFHCFLIYFPWSDGSRCHDLHFLNVEL